MNKKSKKYIKISIIVIIFLFILLEIIIPFIMISKLNKQYIEELNIEIKTNNSSEVYLLLPVLVDEENNIRNIYDDSINSIENLSYKYETSKFGLVLNISFDNNITFSLRKKLNDQNYNLFYWSTVNNRYSSENKVQIYSNSSGIFCSIKYNLISGRTSRNSMYEGYISTKDTWFQIEGYDRTSSE
jgi:hypothetical protein